MALNNNGKSSNPSILLLTAAIAAATAVGASTAVVLTTVFLRHYKKWGANVENDDDDDEDEENETNVSSVMLEKKCKAFRDVLLDLRQKPQLKSTETASNSTPPTPSNFELMLDGRPYNPNDPGIVKLRKASRDLIHEYNNCGHRKLLSENDRDSILHTLLDTTTTSSCHIEPPFHVDYGCNIKVGSNFYANFNLCCLDCATITIGDNVFCGPGVQMYTATHPLDYKQRRETEYALPIRIGDDVWIGGNSTILPGVRIGNRVVVAAGSVVTKSKATNNVDDVVLAGIPAKIVKRLGSEEHADLWFVRAGSSSY